MSKKTVEVEVQQEEDQLPIFSVNMGAIEKPNEPESQLITDQDMVDLYTGILKDLRDDRNDANEMFNNFCDMVINGGDSSTSSKETMVELLKIKVDTVDKMTRVMDLLMRAKLKEKDTFPRYLAASQKNTIKIGEASKAKKKLMKQIDNYVKNNSPEEENNEQ